jgi:hypothetical protein
LDRLIRRLKFPKESLDSFHEAIQSAREVETLAVVLYARVARHLAQSRKEVAAAKFVLRLRAQELKREFEVKDIVLDEEQRKLNEAEDLHTKVSVFLECVDKVISNCKHHREDISKRIRVAEIQYGIKEA